MSVEQYILVAVLIGIVIHFVYAARKQIFPSLFARSSRPFHYSTLVSVLLRLPDQSFNELMSLYKKEFGKGAAAYARRTYQKWKDGNVQPNKKTYERFLVHLPKVMSYDLKCEVLRHFMEEYAAKDDYELDVYTDTWEQELEPLVHQIINKAFTAQLPIEVERKLRWLGDGDMQAAQEILRHSQAEEGKIMISMLRDEFHSMEALLTSREHLKPKVRHVLEFPYGTIKLKVLRRNSWNG